MPAAIVDAFQTLAVLAAEGAAPEGGGLGQLLAPLVIVGVIFYFLVFRPASRERKEREAKIGGLQKHDRVITNAGIHGTVVALDEETVTLKVDENVRIRFTRAAVWQVVDKTASGSSKTAA